MKGALRMKHKILVWALCVSCLLGLTACGQQAEVKDNVLDGSRYHPELFKESTIIDYAKYVEDDVFERWFLEGVTPSNFEERTYFDIAMSFDSQTGALDYDNEYYEVMKSGYDSWYKAVNDLGYNSLDTLRDDLSVSDVKYDLDDDDVLVIDATVQGTKHSALFKIYMGNDFRPTDMGVTVNRSTGEKLENAGLNTLLGMGMAFAILIIISLIISLFPMLFGGNKKKKESDKEIAEKAIESAVTQIADKEEEDLSSDAELVAVIAAAIAAYEGSAPVEGFQVRSIRRVNSKWKANR
jgi:sodium pump decarboxylase gamma subunit